MPSDQPPGSGPSAGEPPDRFDYLPAGFEQRNPLDALRSEWATAYEDMPRAHIMTLGKAGAGKRTLANAIFRKPRARTGAGDRVTDHIEQYSDPELPLTLYDTPGIELSGKEAQEVAAEFLKLIESNYRSNPNEHINLIYYCVRAEDRRLEDYQVELIKTFADAVSVIPVLTQCLGRDEQKVVEFARYLEDRGLPVVGSPISTLALRRIIADVAIEPFGLDELVRVSYREIPDVRRRAFANALRVSIDLKIKQAHKVVNSATMVAGGIGLAPSPLVVDDVLLIGIQLRMIARINVALGFDRIDVETIGSALVGPLRSSMIGQSTSRFLLRFFSFAGNVINAPWAASSTRALGAAYIEGCAQVLRRQLAGETVSASGLKEAARAVLERLKRGTPHPGVQSEPQEGWPETVQPPVPRRRPRFARDRGPPRGRAAPRRPAHRDPLGSLVRAVVDALHATRPADRSA